MRSAASLLLCLPRLTASGTQVRQARTGNLQWETEGWKIKFGEARFNTLGVDYAFGIDRETLIGA